MQCAHALHGIPSYIKQHVHHVGCRVSLRGRRPSSLALSASTWSRPWRRRLSTQHATSPSVCKLLLPLPLPHACCCYCCLLLLAAVVAMSLPVLVLFVAMVTLCHCCSRRWSWRLQARPHLPLEPAAHMLHHEQNYSGAFICHTLALFVQSYPLP